MALTGYLTADHIKGDAQRVGHEEEIEIHGVYWKLARAEPRASVGGRRTARIQAGAMVLNKWCDSASVSLFQAAAMGTSILEARLSLHRGQGDATEYLRITMSKCHVVGYEIGDPTDSHEAPQDEPIHETITLDFMAVEFSYTERGPDGAVIAGHEYMHNFSRAVGAAPSPRRAAVSPRLPGGVRIG